MNPATAVAAESAINTLLQSINDENKSALEAMRHIKGTKIYTGTLAHVDNYAGAVKSTLETIQRQLLEKISALHTEHNKMIPLHQLPIEIFIQIITRALEPFQIRRGFGPTHLGRLVALCEVCKRWSDVINSTPSLWATIDILDPSAMTFTAISRSANHPLNVIGAPPYGSVRSASRLPDRCNEFTSTAMAHSTRWRSIELVVPASEEVHAIMKAAAPHLQSLEVKSMVQSRVHFQNEGIMFQETVSQLHRLGLHGVAIPWKSNILRDLRYLSISDLDEFAPSCEETLEIIRACPGLVEVGLSLKLVAPVETTKKGTPFTLAELRSMSLSLNPSWTLALLEALHMPSAQSISLDLDFNSDSGQLLPCVIRSAHTLFSTVIDTQYQLLITVSYNNCLTWAYQPSGTYRRGREFEITVRNKPASETLEEFLVGHSSARFTPEFIEIDLDLPFDLDLLPFLKKLDGVDRISNIMASGCDLDPLFTYMSNATRNDEWGFPKLEGLTIYDCDYDSSRLLSMIGARYGLEEVVGSDISGGRQDLPPPLKWITVSHVPGEADKDTLSLVQDILGPDCFEFDEDVERP
ncbi:hypothetical protein M407DRAFT_21007 [Tulasnella calospora MUT 4182]|uniref:F-box domain-containing protein n=1 Tax=Tulasnella calospora MUT 4182 TaxID=1051891 RepID=A0A0C3L7Z2_9AGAM|nr:hypothetical protein M407DRAFT_21007 [Tulasnella calospora MUT 4182]